MSDQPQKRKKVVSYTQFSSWFSCPQRYYLDYVKGLRVFEDSLNMSFGTAIHEAIQLFIQTLYTPKTDEGNEMEWCQRCEIAAEKIDLVKVFKESFIREVNEKKIPHTKEEFDEFVLDGESILSTFKDPSNRIKAFPSHKYTLIDIELELRMPIKNEVDIIAFLDIVLQDKTTKNIKILDIKTSTMGWNKYQVEDFTKTSQLVLYKALYSKKFNLPLSKIDVEFYIVKRKLLTESKYPQNRIQIFKPQSHEKNVIEVLNEFSGFVNTCFNPDGTYNEKQSYPKIPGKNKKNCKYCMHLGKNCDGKED